VGCRAIVAKHPDYSKTTVEIEKGQPDAVGGCLITGELSVEDGESGNQVLKDYRFVQGGGEKNTLARV